MLNREDVIRITEEVLKNLSLDLERGHFTDPNNRTIVLKYGDIEISRTSFRVVEQREYEG
jgi:hypothetical protein